MIESCSVKMYRPVQIKFARSKMCNEIEVKCTVAIIFCHVTFSLFSQLQIQTKYQKCLKCHYLTDNLCFFHNLKLLEVFASNIMIVEGHWHNISLGQLLIFKTIWISIRTILRSLKGTNLNFVQIRSQKGFQRNGLKDQQRSLLHLLIWILSPRTKKNAAG